MGLDDLGKKAEGLAQQASKLVKENAGKIDEALKSEQAEGISDKILDGASDLANKVTGGKFADKVEDVRNSIDKNIGNQ